MKTNLGIFIEDLDDISEQIFKSAYTELGNAEEGTRSERTVMIDMHIE